MIRAWHRYNEMSLRLDDCRVLVRYWSRSGRYVADSKVFRSARNFSVWIGLV